MLEPVLTKAELPWDVVVPVLELIDSREELQKALQDPDAFLASAADATTPAAKGLLIPKARSSLEPVLKQMVLAWEDAVPVLERIDSCEELQLATEDPESFPPSLIDASTSMGKQLSIDDADDLRRACHGAIADPNTFLASMLCDSAVPTSPPPSPPDVTNASRLHSGRISTSTRLLRSLSGRTHEQNAEATARRHGCCTCWKRAWKWISTHLRSIMIKVRILISMFQVLTGIATTFNIPYPESYDDMLRWLATIELDLVRAMPLGCTFPVTFHTLFLARTIVTALR